MLARLGRTASIAVVGLFTTFASALAADVGSRQTLDTVAVHTPRNVLEMQFDAPVRPPDFVLSNIVSNGAAPGSFAACKLTATRGLYCLDGDTIRQWQLPIDAATESASFSCRSALAAAPRKSDACTGLTVDEDGAIWIVGLKGNTHSVVKLVPNAANCARTVPGTTYCALDYYTGRPPLVDVDALGRDAASQLVPCAGCAPVNGVIALESRRDVTLFPDPVRAAGPITLAPGSEWGLGNKETLLSTTLLQVPFGAGVVSFVAVTTSLGRVLARNVAAGGVQQLFDIPAQRGEAAALPNAQCTSAGPQYSIRASVASGVVYLTDRSFCEVLALTPVIQAGSPRPILRLDNLASGGRDFTLSTAASAAVAYPPDGVSIAPGVSIDLRQCQAGQSCQIVGSASGKPAAAITSVELKDPTKSRVTLFQVSGLPDCRYRGDLARFDPGLRAVCDSIIAEQQALEQAGKLDEGERLIVSLAPAGSPLAADPATQMLNLKPLLPQQVRSQFPGGKLPPVGKPLLVSHLYRGQADRQYVFDALVAIAEDGVRFDGTFLLAFDVPLLDDPGATPEAGRRCLPSDGGRSLQDWDVMTRVSEKHPSVAGRYIDSITNVDCINPSMSEEVSFSALPYTLELVPDTYDPDTGRLVRQNDALFARFVQKLYGDLEAVRSAYACAAGAALLPAATCTALKNTWDNGKQKLDKCIEAAFQPKQSKGDENCQSFLSQLNNYRADVPASTPASDVANRVGELRARANVIEHVFNTRFLPSIPDNGFCRETRATDPGCSQEPWNVGVPP